MTYINKAIFETAWGLCSNYSPLFLFLFLPLCLNGRVCAFLGNLRSRQRAGHGKYPSACCTWTQTHLLFQAAFFEHKHQADTQMPYVYWPGFLSFFFFFKNHFIFVNTCPLFSFINLALRRGACLESKAVYCNSLHLNVQPRPAWKCALCMASSLHIV